MSNQNLVPLRTACVPRDDVLTAEEAAALKEELAPVVAALRAWAHNAVADLISHTD